MAITAFPIATVAATASNVANVPSPPITATNVQNALNQLAGLIPAPSSGGIFINVKSPPYNAVGNSTTDDTAAIQSAFNAASPVAETVYFPPSSYLISSSINVPTRVDIFGNNASLLTSTAGTAFIRGVTNDFSGQETITQAITVNPTVGSNSLTVASGAAFTVGQHIVIWAGDDITDVSTPALAITANILGIAGNVLTLDRIFTFPITPVGSGHNAVRVYPQYQNDFSIKGMSLECSGSTITEAGIVFYFARNGIIEEIIGNAQGGLNMGFGLGGMFWCENFIFRKCALYHNRNTSATLSKGRMWNFAGCRDFYIYDSMCIDIHDQFAFVEAHSQNINFYNSTIKHYNNPAGQVVFACDLSQMYAENTYVEMPNTYDFVSFDTTGDPFTSARFRNITLRGILPRLMPEFQYISGAVDWSDGTNYFTIDLDSAYDAELMINLSESGTWFLDYGFLLDFQVYTSADVTLANIADVLLGTVGADGSNNNNGRQLVSGLQLGKWVSFAINGVGTGIFGTGGNTYGSFTRITNRPKVLINLNVAATRGYLLIKYRIAPFSIHSNTSTPVFPFTSDQYTAFSNALGSPRLANGVHTVTAGEATALTSTFLTGLDTVTTLNVQILRSSVNVTSTAVISTANGSITVANGAGYTLTNGDKINWIAIAETTG